MNMSLIIMEGNHGDIDADDSTCHGYYIIKFSLCPYTLQAYLSIDGQVIFSSEMVCEGSYLFCININSRYYVLQKKIKIQTIVYIRKIINGDTNVVCYYSKDVLPYCLWSNSQNNYSKILPLHVPMKEYGNIRDEKNRRERIEFEKYFQ